ncbi:MAG TPA: histidine kinase dimerization/phospho-acceptor domain-containing protein [Acidimicrobiales bacterium]|nr:histidine kinase dimerization/phospho-acceptor domain-containing protein [Acidimicrobiales bacterium]
MTGERTDDEARERVVVEPDANDQLRADAEQTAQFLALTAHELRGPITAITGAEILRDYRDELDAAERAESLESILRGGRRMRRLLDDLMIVSRLEARSFDFRLEDVPLAAAVTEVVAELSDQVNAVTVTGARRSRSRRCRSTVRPRSGCATRVPACPRPWWSGCSTGS